MYRRLGLLTLWTALTLGCSDEANWTDSSGYNCTTYTSNGWCTSSAGYGPGWNTSWGTFADLASANLSAPLACCGCGLRGPPNGSDVCQDIPAWMDSANLSCEEYALSGYCTAAGEPGPGWIKFWGSFRCHAPASCRAAAVWSNGSL